MKRIKYTKNKGFYFAEIYDIYARKIEVTISGISSKYVRISRNKDTKVKIFELQSLQNAKRKVRKILKEEFEVNLGEEVRSVLCI